MNYNFKFIDFEDTGARGSYKAQVTYADNILRLFIENEEVIEVIHYYQEETANRETIVSMESLAAFYLDNGKKVVNLASLVKDIEDNFNVYYREEKRG